MDQEELLVIVERIAAGEHSEADIEVLRQALSSEDGKKSLLQLGKYNINIGQGGEGIHIGDRTYVEVDDEAISAITEHIFQQAKPYGQRDTSEPIEVDKLVQQIRSRLYSHIQKLHGKMPLWGIDYWVPLGELFVDVNILEKTSSNRRLELNDLWQEFIKNPSYRSLDRIGLGQKHQRVSGLEVLERNFNLVVVGKPGSGKTTYLQRVVTECNEGKLKADKIPVLVKLREFIDDGREVSFRVDRYLEKYWRLSRRETESVLETGKALILFDGLDEVTGLDGETICKRVKQFSRDYPEVQVVVTCRTQSQESRFERFDYVEVADFNESQVRTFAKQWFQAVCSDERDSKSKSRDFIEHLFKQENKQIRELTITPILLSLTCSVFQQRQAFYSKRSTLYEEGLELFLEKWDRFRAINRSEIYRDLPVEEKIELLSYVAANKFEEEKYVLYSQAELDKYIADFLNIEIKESNVVLRAIEAQHGLLIKRSQKVWSFSHLTFQEYFTAKHFIKSAIKMPALKNLAKKVFNPRWREVLVLAAEILEEPDTFLKMMQVEINSSVKERSDLKTFFNWIDNKARSINSEYKISAVRAFYFSVCTHDDYFRHRLDISLATAIDSNFKPLFSDDNLILLGISGERGYLGLDMELVFDHDLVLVLLFAIDAVNDFNTTSDGGKYDQIVHFLLLFKSVQDFALKKASKNAFSLFSLNARRQVKMAQTQVIEKIRDMEMENAFVGLYSEIPDPFESTGSYFSENGEWWSNFGQSWVDRFREILVSYRNIGYDWELSRDQQSLLSKYYSSNQFLIECLRLSNLVSSDTKREIEAGILLPDFEDK